MVDTTIKDITTYLEKKEFPEINSNILTQNNLNNTYKDPIPYVLNKLYKLYDIPEDDEIDIEPKDLKGKGDPENFNKMIESINDFKKSKLNTLVDKIIKNKEKSINHCLMHGSHIPIAFTVPENKILIFMAPTNRVLNKDKKNYDAFLNLLKDTKFLEDYLKNPACLHAKNFCFKYGSILYPGQKTFDLELSGPIDDNDSKFGGWGFYPNPLGLSTSKTYNLSSYIYSTPGPSVFFIYSCRACSIDINPKLVEVLYYNEDICNFINKNKASCSIKKNDNQDTICDDKLFSKILIDIKSNNKVPYLNFSPTSNNDDKITNIITSLNFINNMRESQLETHTFEKIFKEFSKLHKDNKFFEYIFKISDELFEKETKGVEKALIQLFSNRLISSWIENIDTYFFDDKNNLIYGEQIKNAFNYIKNAFNYIKTDFRYRNKGIILRLILGQFMYYYFYIDDESKQERKTQISLLFDDIIKEINFEMFIKIPYGIKYESDVKIQEWQYCFKNIPPAVFFFSDMFKKNYKLFTQKTKEKIEESKKTLTGGFIKKRMTNKKIKKLKNYRSKRLNGKKH
jgi:hypothetical protein